MAVQYFPNKDNECFGCSLANLLVQKGDNDLARAVFENYRKHPLVADTGEMSFGLSTRLVHDLTGGKYSATLYCEDLITDLEQLTRKEFPEKAGLIVEAIREEYEKGRILINPEKVEYQLPAMLMLKAEYMCHWVVYVDNNVVPMLIDNGQVKFLPINNISYAPGVLAVKKNSFISTLKDRFHKR